MSEYTAIGWDGLGWSLVLVLLVLAVSKLMGLNLERKLIIGCVRTVVQLMAIGYILGWIFTVDNPWVVMLTVTIQLTVAVFTVRSLQDKPVPGARLITLAALLPTYLLVMLILIFVITQPTHWWQPQLVLTLGGMLLGNTLTAVALSLNRYQAEVTHQRSTILASLAVAASWRQATQVARRAAAQAALTPAISVLMTVGLVTIPGMMSGQIIAGLDPLDAVKYQIVVMFMIVGGCTMAVSIALSLVTRHQRFAEKNA